MAAPRLNFSSPEAKTKYLNEIINFFETERGETIGLIAAEEIMTFFLHTFGPELYRQAMTECKDLLKQKFSDLELELDTLASK